MSLTNTYYKISMGIKKIEQHRKKNWLTYLYQAGCRPGRRIADNTFLLRHCL